MGLGSHIDAVLFLLRVPQGHFRVLDKVDQIDVVVDLRHGIENIHFFPHGALVLTNDRPLPEKAREIPDRELQYDDGGGEHDHRFDGEAAQHVRKIRAHVVVIRPKESRFFRWNKLYGLLAKHDWNKAL